MDFRTVIADRRDARIHSESDLQFLAKGAADGSIPDYQLSAWLMAAVLNPLTLEETALLTKAMAESGERLDLSSLPKPWVDKHSSGGVGDKTTLVLLPMLAACGLTLVKMSGKGLGITGGTIDKLDSVPGFRTNLTPEEMVAQAGRIGLALTGQTPRLAPADGVLYALRDATATVKSMPLIVSSILSKKIAGGAEVIVLDVKCGSGAFMQTLDEAKTLAWMLAEVGKRLGVKVTVSITDMDQPLGQMIGNALEVKEAIRVLKNEAPSPRFRQLCIELCAEALAASGTVANIDEGRRMAEDVLISGRALDKAKQWFSAQGAEGSVFESENWQSAPVKLDLVHDGAAGWIQSVDTQAIGTAVVDLGGGRKEKTDKIDPTVGLEWLAPVGTRIEPGQKVAVIHAASQYSAQAAQSALKLAIDVSQSEVEEPPLILAQFGF